MRQLQPQQHRQSLFGTISPWQQLLQKVSFMICRCLHITSVSAFLQATMLVYVTSCIPTKGICAVFQVLAFLCIKEFTLVIVSAITSTTASTATSAALFAFESSNALV
jgi:hypothetical protein